MAAAVGAAFAPAAMAQWLNFSDQTSTRLQLSSVPLNDNQEKDMVAADVNKDGWTDLIVGRKIPFSNPGPRTALLLMNDNGVLEDQTSVLAPGFISTPMDCRDLFIADFDGDTWLDAVFANVFGQAPKFYRNRGNDGGGQWLGLADESGRIGPIPGTPSIISPCAVWAGDIENDGDLDLYFVSYNGDTDFLMVNDGTGNFTDQTATRVGANANSGFGTATEFRDFDLDGDVDIMKVSTLFGEPPFGVGTFILWNNGQGDFDAIPFHTVPSTSSPYHCSAGKLDPGPTWDLYIVQDPQDQVKTATVNGPHNVSWTTHSVSSPRTTGFGGSNHLADPDNDGDLDHGVCPVDVDIPNCNSGGQLALLRNDGNGNLADPYSSGQNFHVEAHDFAWIDINKDGCLDLFVGLCSGWRVFIRESCPPPPCYADCNQSGSLTVADFGCFQTKFVSNDPYADCNQSGSLTVADFGCFQTQFVKGCP
jgi:hypothetical protein